ncbi:YdcF family protein [Staphylococcus gallinarum]|uniref:YdcF family protein n=1 Tax=Staphylococcus gallinarum TaxID=1293 RepID=A0A3A0VW29_STAGA|nr:YdcF family protein [Staphylococcus gallinarum]
MNILPILLCLIIILIFFGMTFNIRFFVRLNIFITQVILGFIVIIINIGTHTYPIVLLATMLVGIALLYYRHTTLLQTPTARLFLIRLFKIIYKVGLFAVSCAYIASIPIAFNAIFYWLASIAFSAIYAFLCYVVCSSSYSRVTVHNNIDALLVLGAGIFTERVTPMLAERLNKALEILKHQPNALIIVSGGQGVDEPISEALAMTRYLVHHGVPKNQIIMEDQSTSTFENIKFTTALLQFQQQTALSIVCITSQFHILRALRFGQKFNLKLSGVGSHTPYHFLEIALIRDFLALMYQYKLILTIYFASLFFICIIALWHIPTW